MSQDLTALIWPHVFFLILTVYHSSVSIHCYILVTPILPRICLTGLSTTRRCLCTKRSYCSFSSIDTCVNVQADARCGQGLRVCSEKVRKDIFLFWFNTVTSKYDIQSKRQCYFSQRVLVLVAFDVDALCACKILQVGSLPSLSFILWDLSWV